MKSTVIFISGPTSSGKTAVSIELASRLDGEIVSCDSMQVYKGMDVLTQAPADSDLSRTPHHLIKVLSPEEEFSAARFTEEASAAIVSILSREKVPVVTGGTGLYMKCLLDGLFSSPPKDEDLRKELNALAKEKGAHFVHGKLREIDPGTAENLHPNDLRRVIRALEVYEMTGKTIEEKKKESEGISSEYDCRLFGLMLDRDILYERINDRVERMFDEGFVGEVERLSELRLSMTAGKAIGIREVRAFLDGRMTRESAVKELKKNTRRYAKRQMTWFRADGRVQWIDADRSVNEIVDDILKRI
jgi:tRNA dimethylallyltransferase